MLGSLRDLRTLTRCSLGLERESQSVGICDSMSYLYCMQKVEWPELKIVLANYNADGEQLLAFFKAKNRQRKLKTPLLYKTNCALI